MEMPIQKPVKIAQTCVLFNHGFFNTLFMYLSQNRNSIINYINATFYVLFSLMFQNDGKSDLML